MGQWQRAEPGHRHLSLKQWEAQQARRERKREQQRAKDEARRERDKARYDEQRCHRPTPPDRGAGESRLRTRRAGRLPRRHQVPGHGCRSVAPHEIEELEQKVERLRAEVARLTPIVGDPEDVVDEHGWLPRDRREHTWWSYRLDRERKVRDLKQQMPELEAALKATTDRAERREHRAKLAEATRDLDRLIAEGPFTAEEMCSECATPMAHHGWVWPPGSPVRPGPAGRPGCAKRDRCSRRSPSTARRRQLPPPKPKPQPLAVVPSGLPIADVVAKLTELQQQFPDAEVRRGRANRWELWAPDEAE